MKRTLLYIAVMAVLGCMASCDVIDENERYVKEGNQDTETLDKVQRVLVEEFTGRMCVNCPDGAAVVHNIEAAYEGRVVVIGIHAGMFAVPVGIFADMDLRTPEGDAYNAAFPYEGNPAAMFNRSTNNGSYVSTNKDAWLTIADNELSKEPVCELIPTCVYDEATRTVKITTEVLAWKNMPADLKLQVQLTENGIVGAQRSSSGLQKEYVHDHVFRTAVNGTWGETMASLLEGETKTYEHTIVLKDNWVAENCNIVVFAYENDTKYVLQCNECPVVASEDEIVEE